MCSISRSSVLVFVFILGSTTIGLCWSSEKSRQQRRRRVLASPQVFPTIRNPLKQSIHRSWKRTRLDMVSRRNLFGLVILSIMPQDCVAQESTTENGDNIRPYAPVEALLPAIRVQRLNSKAVDLSRQLVILYKDENGKEVCDDRVVVSILNQLNFIFSDPHVNILNGPNSQSNHVQVTSEPKVSSYYTRAYIDELKSLPLTEVPLALLTTLGNYRQLNLLRNRQRKLEKENSFRAAFNTYTRQLRFDAERYIWTASIEERKKFIRQYDALPDVSTVITSDLDLRDLIRNQILDAWDDARGEFHYQVHERMNITLPVSLDDEKVMGGLRSSLSNGEWEELQTLLLRSQTFCNQWFAFIPEKDQEDALAVVLKEEEQMGGKSSSN